ncbi:hypothetical protein [Halobacterium bonnevillei]|uniref:DUF5667 domain-containing protein n=1 Tax=Halobacterium bonnevillei TaxID=2692200 RepID=A0A6B0SHH3_9EURY|nr:hypothetical protein [Halobacterium bonnevillei]MXR21118.1 hypothetical protein [Halobacterium bonnevillei]
MRHTTLVTAALVVLAAAIAPLGVAALPASDATTSSSAATPVATNEPRANETNVSPGEQLSAVAGIQEAEIGGEIERRSFGIRIANAASNDSKADVVGETVGDLQERLADLRAEKQRLREARDDGSMSRSQYAARMAELSAKTDSVRRLATRTEAASGELPSEVLRERGVNVTAIQSLRHDAANVTGPDVAAVARAIGGPGLGNGSDGMQGPPENVTRGTDGEAVSAAADVEQAATTVQRASDSVERADELVTGAQTDAADALETAKAQLEEANATLEEARAALDAGDEAEAAALAEQALEQASDAEEHAQTALERSGGSAGGGQADGDATNHDG